MSDQYLKDNTKGEVGDFDSNVVYKLQLASPRGNFTIQNSIADINKRRIKLEINLKDATPSFKVNDVEIVDLKDRANQDVKEKIVNIMGP